jgi:hypothetical protein
MNMTREQIAKRKAELASELDDLNAEEERLLSLSEDRRLAEALHSMQCRWNHTDGCGWFYEIQKNVVNWNGWAHAEYLKKAHKAMQMLPDMSVDEILRVSKALR